MPNTPHEDLATAELDGAVVEEVVRDSGKSLLALGRRYGEPVVIKVLRTDEQFWQTKFAHEIGIYQAFVTHPPPVRVPRLVHTDGHRVLVIEHIPGHIVDAERYPEPVSAATLAAIMQAVTTFAQWSPRSGVLAPVFDYPDRVDRYHRMGFVAADDRAALHALLEQMPPPGQASHGDPLPSNLLRTEHGGCVLLDFEFTGLFLPGFDLAMLHTLLAETPGAQNRIEAHVGEAGIEVPFLINQAIVLSRELRLHTELTDSALRHRRLALLQPQWEACQARLHTWW